jgi:hypothetical protein
MSPIRAAMVFLAAFAALVGCRGTGDDTKPVAPQKAMQRETSSPLEKASTQRIPGPRRIAEGPYSGQRGQSAAPSDSFDVRAGALRPANSPKVEPDVLVEPIPGFKTRAEYLRFRKSSFHEALAVITLPLDYDSRPEKRYPLVIAFGGAGECARTPRDGALAWMGHYKGDEAVATLEDNRLDRADFRGLITEEKLQYFNQSLTKKPYQGVILACPYSPPLNVIGRVDYSDYEKFVIEELVPELTRRYRVREGAVGADGVSMGGARSMYYGLKYPAVFSSVGSVQGAFGPFLEIYEQLIAKNGDALRAGRRIQLITSDKDPMAPSVERMRQLLYKARIPHSFLMLTGPHDYVFNQGPGVISLLLFHNGSLPVALPGDHD